jgi:phospholipase C
MGFSPIAWSRRKRLRPVLAVAGAVALCAGAAAGANAASASTSANRAFAGYTTPGLVSQTLYRGSTSTPIKHLVVIFDENESFDHYFGTYPYAANTDGTPFHAKPGTQAVTGLYTKITKSGPVGPLLTSNPNEENPQRLTQSEALTPTRTTATWPSRRPSTAARWTTSSRTPSPRRRPRAAHPSTARPAS